MEEHSPVPLAHDMSRPPLKTGNKVVICATCETETTGTTCTERGNNALLRQTYPLERILGRGAQGTTILASGPDGTCAIKELQLGRAGTGKRTELIHRAAAVTQCILYGNQYSPRSKHRRAQRPRSVPINAGQAVARAASRL